MKTYKGFKIYKVTNKDWIVRNSDNSLTNLNGEYLGGTYSRNAFTLKEAKERIDKYLENK